MYYVQLLHSYYSAVYVFLPLASNYYLPLFLVLLAVQHPSCLVDPVLPVDLVTLLAADMFF